MIAKGKDAKVQAENCQCLRLLLWTKEKGLFEMFFEQPDKIGTDDLRTSIDHVLKGEGVGYAVANNHGFVDTQYGCATEYLEIKIIQKFVFYAALNLENIIKRFSHLDDDVADETFAYDNFTLVEKNVASFDIACKIDAGQFLKHGVNGLAKDIALTFFFTKVKQRNAGFFYTQYMLGIEGA